MKLTPAERLQVWLSPRKIHKLKLTNSFSSLLAALSAVLFGRLLRGPLSEKLENAFRERFGSREAVIFPHARTALHFILKAMDLREGDEVIMTPLTIADMVNSIHTLGLKPVFVDIEPGACCIDPSALEKAVTPKSRVILVTYLFGLIPDMSVIRKIADRHGLMIVEDCSQCFDASFGGVRAGRFGKAAFFSLTNFKVCSSLFGGMIITDNDRLACRLREFRETALKPSLPDMLRKLLVKDLVYSIFFSRPVFAYFTYFVIIWLERINPGITYRLYSGNIKVILGQRGNSLLPEFPEQYLADYSDAQARVGLASLRSASHRTSVRIRNGTLLRDLLDGVPAVAVPVRHHDAVHVYWRFPVLSADMAGLKRFLLESGIDTAPTYLTLCSREPGFEPYHASLPVAERVKDSVLVVEVNEDMDEADVRRLASLIRRHFSGAAGPA